MEEMALLKIEIDRLYKIISHLNELIGILKAENIFLKNKTGIKNIYDAITDFENGIKNIKNTIPDFDNGVKIYQDTNPDFENGIKNINTANAEFESGTKNIHDTNAEIEKGIKQNINTNANIDTGSKSGINNPKVTITHTIEIDNLNKWNLVRGLKKILPRSTKLYSMYAIAGELLLIHNNGSATYEEMRHIANLSKPGFAKHGPKLIRRGLVQRASHKKYVLTRQSKDIIAKIFPA